MTPFQHRIILPPILVAIHCVLLLPLFLPLSSDSHDLSFKGLPLHLQYSIPLGVTGFVVVMITKQLAVKIPLPKDPRKKRLAEGLEWAVLFLVGFLEEVWRWGVVRILVHLEGGDGGYGNITWLRMNRAMLADTETMGWVLGGNLWEGVYFMGWIWCCIESGFAWMSYGPHREEGRHTTHHHQHHHHHHHHNHGNRHRHEGSPHTSPRTSHFPHSRGSHGASPSTNTADNSDAFLNNPFRTSSIWDGPDTRQTLTKSGLSFIDPPRVEIHPSSSAELSRPTYESQCTFGGVNGFGFHTNMAAESPQSPITGTYNRDLEIAQRQAMDHSDDEYGDDVDDTYSLESESESSSIRSSSETVRSRSATPLLSSSLPYDPNSEHPHQAFEQQSLLQSQYRRMSYNTLAEPIPAPSNTHSDDDEEDYDDEDAPQTGLAPRQYGQNNGNRGPARVSPPRPRAYPSYPSYSASYNHSYFSASPATQNRQLNLNLPVSPRSLSSTVNDSYFPNQQIHEQQQQSPTQRPRSARLPLHHYLRMIYGVDTNSLNIWLPILWRTAALFRGLGHVLLFAWFPCLVHKGQFQIWTFLMVFFIAAQKGWYTVEWVGGTVARNGVIKVSIFTTALSMVVYLVGLKLWDIIP